MKNTLYYGDNLKILRDYITDESIDLIYLDPPFNSNRIALTMRLQHDQEPRGVFSLVLRCQAFLQGDRSCVRSRAVLGG